MYAYRSLSPEQRAEIVRQRRLNGYPPHSPPHDVRDERLYLISAACYEHQTHMIERDRRSELLDLLFESFVTASVALHAWVVVPNHYHILIEPGDFAMVGKVLRFVHATTARRWNTSDERPGRTIWYRYSDRAIRSERHFFTTLNYIHYNPVKHGWSESPYDWEESSVHWYVACHGREWLRDLWRHHPLRAYGDKWDDFPDIGASRTPFGS